MPTLLISGFGPFPGAPVNASWDALQLADPALPEGWTLRRVRLDVVWDRAAAELIKSIDQDTAAVVAFGQADDPLIRLERFALNAPDPTLPDAEGLCLTDPYIEVGGPNAYESGLPIRERLIDLDIPGATLVESHHAGTYLCNFTFYRLMHLVAEHRSDLVAGFVHVPPAERQSLAITAQAMQAIIEKVARETAGGS